MKDGGAVIIFALFYSYIWSGTSGTNVNDNDPAFLQTAPLRFFTMQEQHCQPSVAKCQHIMSEAEQLQVALRHQPGHTPSLACYGFYYRLGVYSSEKIVRMVYVVAGHMVIFLAFKKL